MSFEFALSAFATIFAIVNPIGNIPIFEAVTMGYSKELKKKVIRKICTVTTGVLFVFAIFGQWIFSLYGITIPAFKIAGGLLLFSVAFSMMHGQRSRAKISDEDQEEAMAKEVVGIVPLGIPMFAGPGAITTVMIFVSEAMKSSDMIVDMFSIFISIILTVIISYLLLTYSEPLFRRMGRSGAMAFSRIMGLLLAAVAVNFILSGVFQSINDYFMGLFG
ncbi:MAG: NAAT family transporter [Methanomassiliicoccales archaeon]|nr:NAAT family transporter [Methanomassiliicoccales archaeon]